MYKYAFILFVIIVIFSLGEETIILNGEERSSSAIVSSPNIKTGLYEGRFGRDLYRSTVNTAFYNWGMLYGQVISLFDESEGNNIKIKNIGKRFPKPSNPSSGWTMGSLLGWSIVLFALLLITGSLEEDEKERNEKEEKKEKPSRDYKDYLPAAREQVKLSREEYNSFDKKIEREEELIQMLQESFSSGILSKEEFTGKIQVINKKIEELNHQKKLEQEAEKGRLFDIEISEAISDDIGKLIKLHRAGLLKDEEFNLKQKTLYEKKKDELDKQLQDELKLEEDNSSFSLIPLIIFIIIVVILAISRNS